LRAPNAVSTARRGSSAVRFTLAPCQTWEVKFTELTQTLGQLQQSLNLIGILGQTAGSTGKLWVNPVNFRLGAGVAGTRHPWPAPATPGSARPPPPPPAWTLVGVYTVLRKVES
jgi:hypothetical protein